PLAAKMAPLATAIGDPTRAGMPSAKWDARPPNDHDPVPSLEIRMTTLVDEPLQQTSTSPAQRLRVTTTAIRLSFTWLGVRKTLTPEQRSQAAEPFGAEGGYLSAGKKLLDTGHPAFKAVTAVRGRSIAYWKGISLPFPEPGIRLIRQEDLAAVNVQLT